MMKYLTTAVFILLTTSTTTALRGAERQARDDATIQEDYFEMMEEELDSKHSRHLMEIIKSGSIFTMAVKITDAAGSAVDISNEDIKDLFFYNDISFKNILEGCSYNKLTVTSGRSSVTIDIDVKGKLRSTVEEAAIQSFDELRTQSNVPKPDMTIYCLPPGTIKSDTEDYWTNHGFFTRDGQYHTFLNADYCGDVAPTMWHMGRVMGLTNAESLFHNVGDIIGHMGPIAVDTPKKCFNAPNSYQLDWYTGQYGDLNEIDLLNPKHSYQLNPLLPLQENATKVRLAGVSTYKSDGSNGDNSFVSLRIENIDGNDVYLGYNYKDGINSDVDEHPNKITVHQKLNGAGPYYTEETMLVQVLGARSNNIFSFNYYDPPSYTFRVGTTVVTLISGFKLSDESSGLIEAYLQARSLTGSIDISTLLSDGQQTFSLQYDKTKDYVGNDIVKVRLEHEGESGGNDWYIQVTEGAKIQLLRKTNGPYEEGESTIVTTLEDKEEYEWIVGDNIVTLNYDTTLLVTDSGSNANHYITLSATDITDSPTSSPTNSPTSSPTASPTISPTDSPTSSPTNSPTSSPTASPTISPTASPTRSSTAAPTSAPTSKPTVDCTDHQTKQFEIDLDGVIKTNANCAWLASKKKLKRTEYCGMKVEVNGNNKKLSAICKSTCGKVGFGQCTPEPTSAPTSNPTSFPTPVPTSSPTSSPTSAPTILCEDKSKEFQIDVDGAGTIKTKDCNWIASKKKLKQEEYCNGKVEINGSNKKLSLICERTCGLVGEGECAFLKG